MEPIYILMIFVGIAMVLYNVIMIWAKFFDKENPCPKCGQDKWRLTKTGKRCNNCKYTEE